MRNNSAMNKARQHANCDHPKTIAARTKCRADNRLPPRKGSQMEHIARVVNAQEGIISTRQVMDDLGSENANMISAYLWQLVERGQIQRVGYGLYAALDYEGTTDEN